jgi:hypothetical protein
LDWHHDHCLKYEDERYLTYETLHSSPLLRIGEKNMKCALCAKKGTSLVCKQSNLRFCMNCARSSRQAPVKPHNDANHHCTMLKGSITKCMFSYAATGCPGKSSEGAMCRPCGIEICTDCYNRPKHEIVLARKDMKKVMHKHPLVFSTGNGNCFKCKMPEGAQIKIGEQRV